MSFFSPDWMAVNYSAHTLGNCSICHAKESFAITDSILVHDAKGVRHAFHTKCLVPKLAELNASCPICHEKVTHVSGLSIEEFRAKEQQNAKKQKAEEKAKKKHLMNDIANGNESAVIPLLMQLKQDDLDCAVIRAAETGKANIVRAALTIGTITPNARVNAIVNTTSPQIAESLISGKDLTKDHINAILLQLSAEPGASMTIFSMILSQRVITEDDLGNALLLATKAKNFDAMRAILATNRTISKAGIQAALNEVVKTDGCSSSSEAFQLLSSYESATKEMIEDAILSSYAVVDADDDWDKV